jgi:molybdenum cofactor guanylyltransferase
MTRVADPGPIAGIILAGGRSRRMGKDKADIGFRGQSFLERATTLLQATGCSPVRVSGRPDLPDGIPDREPGQGPARAILDALAAISDTASGALFIPVDMPLLEPADLMPLMATNPARACAWDNHPLPAYLPTGTILTDLAEIRSVKRLLAQLDAVWLSPPAERAKRFSNINSPTDLTSLPRSH